jgi:hypothetical protein
MFGGVLPAGFSTDIGRDSCIVTVLPPLAHDPSPASTIVQQAFDRFTPVQATEVSVRPLEWLFFLSFLPIFCFFVAPGLKRRRLAFVLAAMLPVGSGLLHVVVEGWRAQMLVLYLLAVLMALRAYPESGAIFRQMIKQHANATNPR